MSKRRSSLTMKNMVATSKCRNKVIPCSTPEHEADSPSRDSDSICDSEAASPVPFFCTQDGTDGETDVVWNYYTPKSEYTAKSRRKNSTPLSRKAKKALKPVIEMPIVKRRPLRSTQKQSELFQDLIELNQNLHKFIERKPGTNESVTDQAGSEEDIFSHSSDCSPKSGPKTNSRCLRKNLLSSKFSKPECDTALESDDSMNECLIRASQIVEEKITNRDQATNQTSDNVQDSIDGLLDGIKLETPFVVKHKKLESPCLKNDSFDSFVGNLNDSALELLTQMPVKNVTPVRNRSRQVDSTTDWTLQDLQVCESPSKSIFARHSSMPESPTVVEVKKPSTSGTMFGRHNSMPYNKNNEKDSGSGDSPIRCTPEEIRKKHLQAREKLLAKRLLPFTSTQHSNSSQSLTQNQNVSAPAKKPCFQPRVPTNVNNNNNAKTMSSNSTSNLNANCNTATSTAKVNNILSANKRSNIYVAKPNRSEATDLKLLIEKKRQEALMKLKRKQSR